MSDHLSMEELNNGVEHILSSPKNAGELKLIVRRPHIEQREVIEVGELSRTEGLVGDNWKFRGSSKTEDGSAHPEMQLNLMNARCVDLLAQSEDRWALAGDQFYVDLDLSDENLPPGTQLSIGSAIIEITSIPHNGCKKFANRFGKDAVIFVNSEIGKKNHFRGVNAKVVKDGTVRKGDLVEKVTMYDV